MCYIFHNEQKLSDWIIENTKLILKSPNAVWRNKLAEVLFIFDCLNKKPLKKLTSFKIHVLKTFNSNNFDDSYNQLQNISLLTQKLQSFLHFQLIISTKKKVEPIIIYKVACIQINFMKTIVLALLLLVFITLAKIQPDTTEINSGDNNSPTVSLNKQGDKNSGPSNAKNNQITTQSFAKPLPPKNWNFLKDQSLGGDSEWVTPTTSKKVYPLFWLTVYKIKFTTSCPKKPVILNISATGLFKVYSNDVLVQGWYHPWPRVAKITLKPKCGLNIITVNVFNYYYASPVGIIYTLVQNTNGCNKCLLGRFYNKKTCHCDCIQNVFCLFNYRFDKNLCKCVPKCSRPLTCKDGQVWDAFNCKCICIKKEKDCTGLAIWNPKTCSCFCVDKILCINGFHFDPKLCKCVSTAIQINQATPKDPLPPHE